MEIHEFRQDRHLRATGYNFYSWGVVNVLVTVPLFAALNGAPWKGWVALLYTVGVLTAGIVVAGWNDRYVGKMCGEPAPQPLLEMGNLFLPVIGGGLLLSVMLGAHNENAYVQPLWMIMIGLAYLIWGHFSIPEYKWLGRILMVGGGIAGLMIQPAEVASGLASRRALYVWVPMMGPLWLLVGAYVNRKYIHRAIAEPGAVAG